MRANVASHSEPVGKVRSCGRAYRLLLRYGAAVERLHRGHSGALGSSPLGSRLQLHGHGRLHHRRLHVQLGPHWERGAVVMSLQRGHSANNRTTFLQGLFLELHVSNNYNNSMTSASCAKGKLELLFSNLN